WTWLPKSVEYFISDDGKNFTKIGEVKKKADEQKRGIFTEPFIVSVNNVKARYVKVKTTSLINCPRWHIGYTNGTGKAFIFIDEIVVE
ncbi:MAG: beta-N-acetylhexosaminidase, partial [Bacteroidota bacterium]